MTRKWVSQEDMRQQRDEALEDVYKLRQGLVDVLAFVRQGIAETSCICRLDRLQKDFGTNVECSRCQGKEVKRKIKELLA